MWMCPPYASAYRCFLITHKRTSPLCGWVCRGPSHENTLAPSVNMYQDSKSPIWVYRCVNVQVPYAGGCTKVLVNCGHFNPMCEYAQGLSTPYANIRITYVSTSPNFISKYATTRLQANTSLHLIYRYTNYICECTLKLSIPYVCHLGFPQVPMLSIWYLNIRISFEYLIWVSAKSFQSSQVPMLSIWYLNLRISFEYVPRSFNLMYKLLGFF